VSKWKAFRGELLPSTKLLLLSPLALLFGLLIFDFTVPTDLAKLVGLAVAWSVVAVSAVVVTTFLSYRATVSFGFAIRNYPHGSTPRLLAIINLIAAYGLWIVHVLFLTVGLSTFIHPEASLPVRPVEDAVLIAKQEFGRVALMEGQYILLTVGVTHYKLFQRVRRNAREHELEGE
jgi:hypothetical protein